MLIFICMCLMAKLQHFLKLALALPVILVGTKNLHVFMFILLLQSHKISAQYVLKQLHYRAI